MLYIFKQLSLDWPSLDWPILSGQSGQISVKLILECCDCAGPKTYDSKTLSSHLLLSADACNHHCIVGCGGQP